MRSAQCRSGWMFRNRMSSCGSSSWPPQQRTENPLKGWRAAYTMDPSACGPVTQNNEIRRDVTYSATLSAGFRIEWRTFGPAAAQYIQHVPDLESCPAWVSLGLTARLQNGGNRKYRWRNRTARLTKLVWFKVS